MATRCTLKTAGHASIHLRYTICRCCHRVASLQGSEQLQTADIKSLTVWLISRCNEPAYHPSCDLLPNMLHYNQSIQLRTYQQLLPSVAIHAYRILLKELFLPYKGLNQELVHKNRAASLPLSLSDASSVFKGNIAKPVTGPSLNQFDAFTAAL